MEDNNRFNMNQIKADLPEEADFPEMYKRMGINKYSKIENFNVDKMFSKILEEIIKMWTYINF